MSPGTYHVWWRLCDYRISAINISSTSNTAMVDTPDLALIEEGSGGRIALTLPLTQYNSKYLLLGKTLVQLLLSRGGAGTIYTKSPTKHMVF